MGLNWTAVAYNMDGWIGGYGSTVARSKPRLNCKCAGEQTGVDFI